MPQPVFLSYARRTSREQTVALHRALDPANCFLDLEDIERGANFPRSIIAALLASRVFVAFVDDQYFGRWYCLREWLLARAAHDELMRHGAPQAEIERAIDHVVLAFPDGQFDTRRLPPTLQATNWPSASDTAGVAALVRAKLQRSELTLLARFDAASVPNWRRESMVTEASLPPPRNLGGIPMYPKRVPQSLGSGFVGRVNDVWRLHVALTEPRLGSSSIAALTGALQGGGGFGKTQLAREYLHRFGPSDYASGLFWIDATEAEPLDRQFHGVLRELRRDTPSLEEMRTLNRDVRRELEIALHEDARSSSILIVVDNVPEPAAGSPPEPLDRWCPALGKVTCLVTSRKRVDDSTSVDSIDIDVLETGAAIELLRRGVSNAAALSDVQWQRIAEWVGHLPLALTLLNAALRRSSISLQKLVTTSSGEGLTQILDAQMDALRPSVPTGVLRGITEAFTLSYELLADGAKVLARRIAWLAAAPISDEFLDVLSKPGSRVQLIDRSFLVQARTQTATRSGWEMHCVLGDFLRSRNQDARQEQLVALAAIRSVCRSLDLDRPRDQILGMGVVVHTRYVLEHLRRMLDVTSTVSNLRDWGTIAVVGFWMGEIGTRLGERTALDASILAYRTASLLARREDAPVEWATTQCSLGTALATLGTQERHEEGLRRLYEATSAYEAALKVSTCERSPVDWATTMHNIGNVLAELGYREENPTHLNNAVSAYQAALEVRTRESRPLEWAATQAALAAVLATLGALEGRPTHCQEAIVAYGAALEVFTRDRVPMEWARIRYNRGNMFKDLGMNEEGTNHLEAAVLEYRAALEVRTRERAPLDWWATQNNLGAVLMELGSRQAGSENLEEALSVFQAALEMRTRECAPLDWALTQFNLGGVFCRLGLRGEGTSHLENAVSAYHAAMQIYAVSSADPMLQLVRDHLDQVETLLRQRRDHA